METLGKRIQELRKKANLKQEDLASKLNVTPQAVSKWENDISSPDISLLSSIADILNTTTDDLLGRKRSDAVIVEKENIKDISKLILKIDVLSQDGDKVKVNLPLSLIQVCLNSGLELPKVNGKDILSSIDFNQIFSLIEYGMLGEIVTVESKDGDKVRIFVE